MQNLNPSNICHKAILRIADMIQVIGGFKESNRHEIFKSVTANNTAVDFFNCPWAGKVEAMIINSPTAATTSTSGSHVTVTITDVTSNAVISTFDTHTNATELTSGSCIYVSANALTLSNGAPASQFNAGDVLSITVQVTGTPGITSSNSLEILFQICPVDKNYTF